MVQRSGEVVSIEKLRKMVLASLMAALTAVGSTIFVPIGPVPIVLTTLFVLLSGLLLGSRWGLASMGLYLLVGAMGMPVFAGGRGGLPHFFGPTGGYLFAANQEGHNIVLFRVDAKTGRLTPTGQVLEDSPEPTCVLFVPAL